MLGIADWLVLSGYLLLVAWIGFAAGRGQRTTEDYFLGGRRIPWWVAGLSIIATETSALTFIGAPTQSLRGDWTYLQLAFGSVLARFLVAGLLIGVYYRARVFSVYGWLGRRFGPFSRGAASLLFFLGRSLGSGVRLYGAAIALVVLVDLDFPLAIALLALVAVAYTIAGGIRSVVWTDALQGVLLVGGGVLALVWLGLRHEGGIAEAFTTLADSTTPGGGAKLRILDLSWSLRDSYTLFAGLVASTFLTMSTHGTDQDMIQRALSCRGERAGRASLWLSAFLNIPIVLLFLAVGSMLWLHYGGDEGAARAAALLAKKAGEANPAKGYDYLFPFYVVSELPAGIKGLILAGLFAAAMSSLDSAIAALSSTAVKCIWQPYVAPGREEGYYLKVSRGFALFFGAVLAGIALLVWVSRGSGGAREGFGVLMLGLKVLTWIFPPLLGIFLCGVLTDRGGDLGNLVALAFGIGTLLFVEFWKDLDRSFPDLGLGEHAPWGWIWNGTIGCLLSFGLALLFRGPGRSAVVVEEGSARGWGSGGGREA